jgi:HD-like signal output (HDOD) protein
MKTRILFVDDEPLILEGLQRMLRGMREEWDMEFLDGGESALERMNACRFDVVVSDMRMPGMNGAELLNEVMRRHPKVVRLILSGHADRDLILRCVGATHQFLAKPCRPEDLKLTISRATMLETSLRSEPLRRLVGQMERLPSLPTLYSDILEKCRDPEAGLDDVARIVARDPGMTAMILKLVNSAFFGLGRSISNVQESLAYLGLETVKALVLSVHAFTQFEGVRAPGFSFDQLWTHSLETAGTARLIARLEDADGKFADEAFVAGLLHDTGKLVLASNFSRQYGQALRASREQDIPMIEAERRVFAASHADVGGYLLGLWGLPVPVVEAIALHHTPGLSANRSFTPLTAVHGANYLVTSVRRAGAAAGELELDRGYLEALGLQDRLEHWRQAKSGGGG